MFFDINPGDMIPGARYYFDVCVIDIAVRKSLKGEFEEIWDLSRMTSPRPIVYHIFQDDDRTFRKQEKFDIQISHHCVVEVNGSEIAFFTTDSSMIDVEEQCDEDEDGDLLDGIDFWRF